MTAQQGGDVTRFTPGQYDPETRTIRLSQGKTDEALLIHVPPSLARARDAMQGKHPARLFVTPRGKPWKLGSAQETLQRLLGILGLPRYTLHGLRATGPVALKMLGFENRAIRALTGHTSDANLGVYLRGVDHYPLAKASQEALEQQFGDLLAEAEEGANARKYSGVTGRAALNRSPGFECLPSRGALSPL
jgi:integrase